MGSKKLKKLQKKRAEDPYGWKYWLWTAVISDHLGLGMGYIERDLERALERLKAERTGNEP